MDLQEFFGFQFVQLLGKFFPTKSGCQHAVVFFFDTNLTPKRFAPKNHGFTAGLFRDKIPGAKYPWDPGSPSQNGFMEPKYYMR